MNLQKFKSFTGKIAMYGVLMFMVTLIVAFISVISPAEANKSYSDDNFARLQGKELIGSESVDMEKNNITFCGERIEKDDLSFMLEFIASTESQGHQFMPKDSVIKSKAWKLKNSKSTAIGKWQMLKGTRESCAKYLGEKVPTDNEFLNDTTMQIRYVIAYFEMCNDVYEHMPKLDKKGKVVRDSTGAVIRYNAYDKYVGKVIGGCYITKSGMLVLAHSIGVAGAIIWIEKGCKPNKLPKGAPIAMNGLTCQVF